MIQIIANYHHGTMVENEVAWKPSLSYELTVTSDFASNPPWHGHAKR
jgi:hypothetical protein